MAPLLIAAPLFDVLAAVSSGAVEQTYLVDPVMRAAGGALFVLLVVVNRRAAGKPSEATVGGEGEAT